MKISIIIPIHNGEKFVETCIYSFLLQNYSMLELILVNDHSNDMTEQICLQMQKKHSQIVYVSSKGHGVSAARNTGISIATGDIIGFCDVDDTAEPMSLSIIANAFNEQIDLLVGGFYIVYKKRGKVYRGILEDNKFDAEELAQRIIYDKRIMGSVWNKFFRREILKEERFSEELSYCEDMHFLISLLSRRRFLKAKIIGTSVYNYHVNEYSVTNDIDKMFNNRNELKYIEAMNSILKECSVSKRLEYLIMRNKYILASNTLYGFTLQKEQENMLKVEIKENKVYFWRLFGVNFSDNLRWLLILQVKKIRRIYSNYIKRI